MKGNHGAKIDKAGGVVNELNKTIGRSVVSLKGTVSANNYFDILDLQLTGAYVYIQLCIIKPNVATFHLELTTDDDLAFRISLSTLHREPRFLCRQLRLPLPTLKSGAWMVAQLHMNEILERFCTSPGTQPLKMKHIKVIISYLDFLFSYLLDCSLFGFMYVS